MDHGVATPVVEVGELVVVVIEHRSDTVRAFPFALELGQEACLSEEHTFVRHQTERGIMGTVSFVPGDELGLPIRLGRYLPGVFQTTRYTMSRGDLGFGQAAGLDRLMQR
tara:strand:+ start:1394 stop:1723 length:330 start_codon:yes stop_codon:yes gene_type:complete